MRLKLLTVESARVLLQAELLSARERSWDSKQGTPPHSMILTSHVAGTSTKGLLHLLLRYFH